MSLQSGSDDVLRRMNRKYTSGQFAGYLENIRSEFNLPAITTDIITGFPGETDEAFRQTCDFAREQRFSRIHVFPYSEREGTPAASMKGSVPVKAVSYTHLLATSFRVYWKQIKTNKAGN